MSSIDFNNKTILITGAAGFIGYYLADRICAENPNAKVIGYDSVNDYYDPSLKQYRLKQLKKYDNGQIALMSDNPAYPPMYFNVSEIEDTPIRIRGVVKELRRTF